MISRTVTLLLETVEENQEEGKKQQFPTEQQSALVEGYAREEVT